MNVTVSTEPDAVSRYFDKRGWPGEARGHAEVVEVFRPSRGWERYAGRKKVNDDLLVILANEGVTKVTLRVRFAESRVVSADFKLLDLLA